MAVVAFQGIAGAYSEEAVRRFFGPDVETRPCRHLEEVFVAVESGVVAYGVVPIENSTAGSVLRTYELLMEHDLRIYAETVLRVRHMLLAPPGTCLETLNRVRSHPQALAQCQRYLSSRGLEAEPAFDTAGSARDLSADPEPGVAAIASAWAATLYGLEILDRDIADVLHNYTRFFVLSIESPPRAEHVKTSLVFTVPHRPGTLYDCLGEFARRQINLTKIESRPRLHHPWQYLFYLDFEGHVQDPPCAEALLGLLQKALFVKLLGSYPAADLAHRVPEDRLESLS